MSLAVLMHAIASSPSEQKYKRRGGFSRIDQDRLVRQQTASRAQCIPNATILVHACTEYSVAAVGLWLGGLESANSGTPPIRIVNCKKMSLTPTANKRRRVAAMSKGGEK
ncbi:hypothetical protein PG985_000645 [Apiospora marii]|uniref:Uncharacterized protein n=1 Tax=Apiospora marii TaxID=335849 RepID=A0ABR1R3B6_9PEZI